MEKEDLYNTFVMQNMYFSTPEMTRIFSDANRVQKQMDVEAALADVEADLGIIPRDKADEIIKKSHVELLDFEAFKKDFKRTGHPFVPLVHAYKQICDSDAGEYVHWGATTQDILDTGTTLQLREAYDLLMKEFERLYAVVADKAYEYKDQIMIGRTNGQQALPITLGYKISVWGFEIRENLDRLHECCARVFRGLFAGAVGTLASLGDKGMEVQERLLQKLGLTVPPVAWSVSRHHYAELLNNIALMASTMGKIGSEFYALQKTEIAELAEAQGKGAIGSSTMPHKRNPFRAMELVTNAKIVRGCAATMMNCLELEHERDPRSASTEIVLFTRAFSVTHASVLCAIKLIQNMQVYPKHMERNLNVLHGLVFSEAIMMELGKRMGRQTAHAIVHELCMQSYQTETPLAELLECDARTKNIMTPAEIQTIMQPKHYIGFAPVFPERLKKQKDEYFANK